MSSGLHKIGFFLLRKISRLGLLGGILWILKGLKGGSYKKRTNKHVVVS